MTKHVLVNQHIYINLITYNRNRMTLVFSTDPKYSSVKRPNMTMMLNSYSISSKIVMDLSKSAKKGCRSCGG